MFLTLFILGLYYEVLNTHVYIIQQKGNLDQTCSDFLNSDLSFQGVWNAQTINSVFFLSFFL